MERRDTGELGSVEEYFSYRFNGRVKHTETGEELNVASAEYEDVEEFSLNGIYEHYKSTPDNPKLYYVGSVKRDIETGECLVVYCPLYESDEMLLSARPLSMFTGSVDVDGEELPRFRPMDPEYE